MAEGTIDKLQIVVTADTKQAETALEKLQKSLQPLADLTKKIGDIDSIKALKKQTSNTSQSMVEISRLAENAAKSYKKLGTTAGHTAAEFAQLQSRMKEILPLLKDVHSYSDAFSKAQDLGFDIGEAGRIASAWVKNNPTVETAKKAKSAFVPLDEWRSTHKDTFSENMRTAVGDTLGIAKNLVGAFTQLAGLSAKVAFNLGGKAFETLKKAAASFRQTIKNIAGSLTDRLSKNIKGFSDGFKKLAQSFGRVLKYKVVSFILNQISAAIKVGTKSFYEYSRAIGGDFSKNLDNIATGLLYFKNSVGAAVAPIVNVITPAIDVLIDKVVEAVNWFNQLISKLTGASTWTKAIRQQTTYAEATTQAADATKRLLAGFDELNIIGTSSNSKATGTNVGGVFEEVALSGGNLDFDFSAKNLAKKLNEAIKNLDLTSFTNSLTQKINTALKAIIDFGRELDLTDLGEGVAASLNDVISGINAEDLGAAFAQKFNTITELIGGFVSSFDWAGLGTKIGTAVNGWFSEINWQAVGAAASDTAAGVITTLDAAITTTDFSQIGSAFVAMFSAIDWQGISDGLIQLVGTDLINAANTLFGTFSWAKAGESLGKAWNALAALLTDMIHNINWTGIATAAADVINSAISTIDWNATAKALSDGVISALSGLNTALANVDWEAFGDSVADFLCGIDWVGVFNELLGVMTNSLNGLASGLSRAIGSTVAGIFTGSSGGEDIQGEMTDIGNNTSKSFKDGLETYWENTPIGGFIEGVVKPLVGGFKDRLGINSPSTVMEEIGEYTNAGLVLGLEDNQKIFAAFSDTTDGLLTGISGFKSDLNNSLDGVTYTLRDGINNAGDVAAAGFNAILRSANDFAAEMAKITVTPQGDITKGITFTSTYAGSINFGRTSAIISGIQNSTARSVSNAVPQTNANGNNSEIVTELQKLRKTVEDKESNVVIQPSAALGRVNKRSEALLRTIIGD